MRRRCAFICSKRSSSANFSSMRRRNSSSSAISCSLRWLLSARWYSLACIISSRLLSAAARFTPSAMRCFSSCSSKYSRLISSSISSRLRSFSSFSALSRARMRSASSCLAAAMPSASAWRRRISAAKRAICSSSWRRRARSASRRSSRMLRKWLTHCLVSSTFCALRRASSSSSSRMRATMASTCARSFTNSSLALICICTFSCICSSSTTRPCVRVARFASCVCSSAKMLFTRFCSIIVSSAVLYWSLRLSIICRSSSCSLRS
mmetsp:Transcript_18281/g.45485  ORF Transcript_18281/g.45485 Transcript_18281/m.45485 type:complete len:265 (-) Transcript_18281:439-1233(-)